MSTTKRKKSVRAIPTLASVPDKLHVDYRPVSQYTTIDEDYFKGYVNAADFANDAYIVVYEAKVIKRVAHSLEDINKG